MIKDLGLPHSVERLKDLTLFNIPRRRLKGFLIRSIVTKWEIQRVTYTAVRRSTGRNVTLNKFKLAISPFPKK